MPQTHWSLHPVFRPTQNYQMNRSLNSKSFPHFQVENLHWVAPHCLPDAIQNSHLWYLVSKWAIKPYVALLWPCQLRPGGSHISSTSGGLAHRLTPELELGQDSRLEYLSPVLHLRRCFEACPKHRSPHNFSNHRVVFPTTCGIPRLHQRPRHLTLLNWVLLHTSVGLHMLPSPNNLPSSWKTKTFREFLSISTPTKTPTQTKC